ncbi:unnamed protein product [Parascedosporium putredinis]|uniref:CN hydrolase domain-containing protein n=1 Tax=Parascedosporium putredinis TaxID=1442378 RepID=A0A9P1HCD0_9PEZI|nr:unnamed protein product [Parascedosporium putredinis]CAI8003734.1 unnamed protein product [Parascedosporium putredinis]
MALKFNIALIQLYPKPLSPAHNFARAESEIRAAASSGARLAVLPELLPSLRALAASLGIAIVPGTLVEELSDGTLANVCYFISSTGELVGRYEKRNLWHPERGVMQPGREPHDVFDTEFGPVGLLVCWDLAFPEAMRSSMIICRAFENTCAVVFVNAGAPSSPAEEEADTRDNDGVRREYAGLSQLGMPILGARGNSEQ